MMIAPRGRLRRSERPTPNIGPLDSARGWSLRSWRHGRSADTQDKARTARLQGQVKLLRATKSDCSYKKHAAEATSCQCVAPPLQPSGPRFVLSVLAVSVSP